MSLKRFIIVGLVISGFGSVQAVIDQVTEELLDRAVQDQKHFEAFEEHFRANPFDVDELMYTLGVTVSQHINTFLGTQHRAAALTVARLVLNESSDKSSVFRELYKLHEEDQTVLADLEHWIEDFPDDLYLDVDDIYYDPANEDGGTIGEHIVDRLKTKDTRKAALDVAILVDEYRANRDIVMQTLYAAYEKDHTVLEDIKKWIVAFEGADDVDEIDYNPQDPGKTIGDRITERLRTQRDKKEALAVAAVVQEARSCKKVIFRELFKDYLCDNAVYAELEGWFLKFPLDIDMVFYDRAKRIETIGDRLAKHLRTNTHRKEALAVAKLVQGARSLKNSVLLTLFKACEKDPTVFSDLKEWQEFVKADVSKIYYDSAKKITIAQKVAALNRDDVSNLFKHSTITQPVDGKKAKWSMGKKVGVVTALAAGAGLLYYLMNNKDSKNKLSEQPQLPAAA